eukprot:m.178581 g.178581  ORF g.178581 m.178581 type:complete len:736 (-) comp14577_c0_seq1:1650-3857(-)
MFSMRAGATARRWTLASFRQTVHGSGTPATALVGHQGGLGTVTRDYNFASTEYIGCFGNLPPVDMAKIRSDTVKYIESFDAQAWYERPVCTIVQGVQLDGSGQLVPTPDAFGVDRGRMLLAPEDVVDEVIRHMRKFTPPSADLREPIRQVEAAMLSTHAAALVGNQAIDFGKQDGVTEIEESLEANEVERRMNDLLIADEVDGKVSIHRAPALVGCVSNFSNFLDLCRKTLRNLELGIPVVILSRSNTTQHSFRWTELLLGEMAKAGVDPGMVTYAACSIDEQRRIMAAASDSPLYLTSSRPVAAAIKELVPATFASTGGPNTMVATKITPAVEEAIMWSTAIENSGQCTALRHLVVPGCSDTDAANIFKGKTIGIESPVDSLRVGGFAGLYKHWAESFVPDQGYLTASPDSPVALTVRTELPTSIKENWRRLYVDVTSKATAADITNEKFVDELAQWLVREQPITLAVNDDDTDYKVALALFEKTSQVVYSVGTSDAPALSCQARPQEAEVFGEFPPRKQLSTYTKFPVIVPSSTPGYNTEYTVAYLAEQAQTPPTNMAAREMVAAAESVLCEGYMTLVANYLQDAASGPKRGYGARTTLWGLQRPPLNTTTVIRAGTEADPQDLALYLLPFHMTNARSQVAVSVHPRNTAVLKFVQSVGGYNVKSESFTEFKARTADNSAVWNTVQVSQTTEFELVAHFISLLFPLGHIKSVKSNDENFVTKFSKSDKWLRAV